MYKLALIALAVFTLSACGSDSDPTLSIQVSDAEKGVATVTVTAPQNSEGTAVTVTAVMNMSSGMTHGTPMLLNSGTLNSEKTFTTTAYFLMPSNMPNGMAMGDWFIDVSIDDQVQRFPIVVEMMSSDVRTLKGNDEIMGMSEGTTTQRPYYVFQQQRILETGVENSFEVFIAARESMMDYSPISQLSSTTLNANSNFELTVTNVSVEMCAVSCTNESNWELATEDANSPGTYKANFNLTQSEPSDIYLRLSVNDDTKKSGEETEVAFSFTTEM